jgi:hypothetical protein
MRLIVRANERASALYLSASLPSVRRRKELQRIPPILVVDILRVCVETYLAAEANSLDGILWLPLGPKPTAVLKHLASKGVIDPGRILEGMPHPSGANAERIAFFLGNKSKADLSPVTKPEQIELARQNLCDRVSRLL